jgi:hypothetical protein
MKERQAYRIYSLEDWRHEKLAGEPLRARVLRLTAIVWVPVLGFGTILVIKMMIGVFLRIVTVVWRAIFR